MSEFKLRVRGKLAAFIFGPLLCLPNIPWNLFIYSIVISIGLTSILAILGIVPIEPLLNLRNPHIDALTSWWFLDPFVWQIIVGLLASFLVFRQAKHVRGADIYSRIMASGLPFVVFAIVWVVGDFLIKPAFGVLRPQNPLPEPPVTVFIRSLISSNSSEPDSMPSGFVMRQVALFYTVTWMVIKGERVNKWVRILAESVAVFGLVLVAFSRIYRGAHTLLDVSGAIAIGTLLFWIFVISPFTVIQIEEKEIPKICLSALIGATIVVFAVFLGFSNNAASLFKIFTSNIIIMGGIYLVSPLIYLTDIQVFETAAE